MSLILEALRKSEAERRRGSAPDVAMELPPVSAARARATPAWLLPAILLGVIALLATWWWSQRDAVGADHAEAVTNAPVTEPHIETPAQPVVIARPVQATSAPSTSTATPAINLPPAPVAAAPVAPAARPAPSPAAPPDTRDVADIDATSIPPVKLSMHMWDESPARRFVILDGQRMTEGDRNGELSVVAIERDGVVVERNGQRARVPLP